MPDIFWGEKNLNFICQIPMPGILSPKLWSPPTTSLPPSHPSHYPPLIPPKILCPPLLEHDC